MGKSASLFGISLLLLAALPVDSRAGEECVVVAFGNSLTEGYGISPEAAYPTLLEGKLRSAGYPCRVINRGISGETSDEALQRVDRILALRPKVVILETGLNDAFQGIRTPQIERNIGAIIERLKGGGTTVILAGMQMIDAYRDQFSPDYERLYADLARTHGTALIPAFLEGVTGRPELNLFDGVHPNAAGYRIIADTVYPYVVKALKERP